MLKSNHDRGCPFRDRQDALFSLLEVMPTRQMLKEDWIVVAISTGGVILAKGIAEKIQAPLDFLFTEPVVAPNNTECQIAMVSETEEIVIHEALADSFDIKLDYIYGEAHRKYEEKTLKYIYRYRKGALISSLTNKNVLLVDEGIDSGLTLMASVKTAINLHARSVSFATPVLPYDVAERVDEVIDELYYIFKPKDFVSVSHYYSAKEEVDPKEIDSVLQEYIIKRQS